MFRSAYSEVNIQSRIEQEIDPVKSFFGHDSSVNNLLEDWDYPENIVYRTCE